MISVYGEDFEIVTYLHRSLNRSETSLSLPPIELFMTPTFTKNCSNAIRFRIRISKLS
ncbi:hypothetical protein IC582_010817 [Cucumis melo]